MPHTPDRRGIVLILSSPSGAGKTTLTRMLLQNRELDLTLSISVTTRARRSSEVDGIHYSFISQKRFESMRDSGELLEWAEVHGNSYGTPRETIERRLDNARNEIQRWKAYDYVLVNDDLQKTFDDLIAILRSERQRRPRRMKGIEAFVERLLSE